MTNGAPAGRAPSGPSVGRRRQGPDLDLDTLDKRRAELGPFELATSFRYGGIPYDEAKRSMRLFAREVLPVLHSWD